MSDRKFCSWEEAVLWLKSQPDQGEIVKACYYDDPLLVAAERFVQSAEWQAIRACLPNFRGRVLDLGAGRGISSYAFAKEGWTVTALEPDPSDIVGAGAIRELSEQAGLSIEVVQAAGELLPFSDMSFDAAYGRAILHHAKDLARLCREVFRVLRPHGMLIATREHVISRRSDLERFLAQHPLHALYGGENALLPSEYKDAMRAAGFMIIKVFHALESDINLHPNTRRSIREKIGQRLRLPIGDMIPGWLLDVLGHVDSRPGRLYSFMARKPAGEIRR